MKTNNIELKVIECKCGFQHLEHQKCPACFDALLEAMRDIVFHEKGDCDCDNIEDCSGRVLKIALEAIQQAEANPELA